MTNFSTSVRTPSEGKALSPGSQSIGAIKKRYIAKKSNPLNFRFHIRSNVSGTTKKKSSCFGVFGATVTFISLPSFNNFFTMPVSYSVERKLVVIKWHRENGSNFHLTSRHFNIDRKRIREWMKKENELLQNDYGNAKKKRKIGAGKPALSEEMDDAVLEFLENERVAGRAVTNKMLQNEALRVAKHLGLKDFKASDNFLNRWKKRMNVSLRVATNESQKTPEELSEKISSFRAAVRECRIRNDLTLYNIGNMDQTMVRFDCPPSRTNNIKGESSIRIVNTGCKKRGFTVALTARASGHKMPAFIILKEPTGRIPPKVYDALRIPVNVRVTCTKNGWMNGDTFAAWVSRVWGPDKDDVPRMLVLDKAPIHTTPEALKCLRDVNTEMIIIPGGLTSIVQPADIVWNKPFKGILTEKWMQYMRLEQRTNKNNLKKATRQDVINWVSSAWESITEEKIKRSFKLCGISNALDGSEDGEFNERLASAIDPSYHSEELKKELMDLSSEQPGNDENFETFSDEE